MAALEGEGVCSPLQKLLPGLTARLLDNLLTVGRNALEGAMGASVTTYDIAREAGVSRTTVSFVLNGRMDIAIPEQTRARIIGIARELGYQANHAARALASGKTRMVALWTYGLYDASFIWDLRIMRGILKNDGYDTHVVETDDLVDEKATWLNEGSWPVDAIVAFESPRTVDAYLDAGHGNHTPIVSVGAHWSERADFVGTDLFETSLEAVQHLLSKGRKRVSWFAPDARCLLGQSRYDAYTLAMRQAGLSPEYIGIPLLATCDECRTAFEMLPKYISSHGCPEALFCSSDEIAIGAQRALQDLGLRIPDDVAIVGCEGIEETAYHHPRISTIEAPVAESCRVAWEFLKRRMEDPSAPRQQMILKPKLVIRESSG